MLYRSARMPTANKQQNLFKSCNLGMSFLFMVISFDRVTKRLTPEEHLTFFR
jgi:hypothetical protein